jgi:hypothetical protein
MKTTTKKSKLTVTEKRASAYCDELNHYNGGTVTVDWKRSATWGSNPSITHHGGKCCSISGCGYDKLSAALAEVLRFLFPMNSEAHNAIGGKCGAGVSSVQSALAKHGWTLAEVASGKSYDVFTLTRNTAEPATVTP